MFIPDYQPLPGGVQAGDAMLVARGIRSYSFDPSLLVNTEVSSISALRTLPYAIYGTGTALVVTSYSAAGDNGGGIFVWNGSSTAPDDGGTIINPTGNTGAGRWLRQYSAVTPQMFGATGNGSTDDTAAIAAAVACLRSGSGTIYLPTGIYAVSPNATTVAIVLPSNVRLKGDGPNATILRLIGSSGVVVGNTNRANAALFGAAPPTSLAAQTDVGCEVIDIGFDLTGVIQSSACSWFLARRTLVSNVTVTGTDIVAASAVQHIGCDEPVVTNLRAFKVLQAIDNWKGSTRLVVDGLIAESVINGGNGGLFNWNAGGSQITDGDPANGADISNATFWIHNSTGMFLDSFGAGGVCTNIKLSNVTIRAKSGTTANIGLVGRGDGGLISASNLFLACDSGAAMSSPILIGAFYDQVATVSKANALTTTAGSSSVVANRPGNDLGVGNFILVSASAGGNIVANGLTFANQPCVITAVAGPLVTFTVPNQTATASGVIATSANMQGFYGSYRNCRFNGVTMDGCGAAGSDLIVLQGSGHQIDNVVVTQNYGGSPTPSYRSIVSVDSSQDFGNAHPVPTQVRSIIGAAGTGALAAGFSGTNRVTWRTGALVPDFDDLNIDGATPQRVIGQPTVFNSGITATVTFGTQGVTFVPQLQFSGANAGMTTSAATGEYTIAGNMVFFSAKITLTSKGTSTGSAGLVLTGLPAPNAMSIGAVAFNPLMTNTSGITTTPAMVFLYGGQNILYFAVQEINNPTYLYDTAFTNTSTVAVSGFYFTS